MFCLSISCQHKTAFELNRCDWCSDACSSDPSVIPRQSKGTTTATKHYQGNTRHYQRNTRAIPGHYQGNTKHYQGNTNHYQGNTNLYQGNNRALPGYYQGTTRAIPGQYQGHTREIPQQYQTLPGQLIQTRRADLPWMYFTPSTY